MSQDRSDPVAPSTSTATSNPSTPNPSPRVNAARFKNIESKIVYLNGKPFKYLLDTGADFSVIDESCLKRLKLKIDPDSSFQARAVGTEILSTSSVASLSLCD